MTFQLAPLPYPAAALAPHISARTVDIHHGKHHGGYVANLNRLLNGSERRVDTLTEVIRDGDAGPIFNNAAQVWNHDFYWSSMSPDGGGEPTGDLAMAIESSFGTIDGFRKEFTAAASTKFGSGWTWLVRNESGLAVINTDDADTPLRRRITPLLTLDVWEHAYYLDYQNGRLAYIEAWLEHLVNWEFAAINDRPTPESSGPAAP